jgi:excisionase family DNA binding protein
VAGTGDPELIDLKDAAHEARVSVPTIYRWISQGLLTPYRPAVGRKTQVDRRQIKELLRPKPEKRKGGKR